MKKSKLLALGLIALVLAGGLVLASCDGHPNCAGGGSSGKKGTCKKTYTATTTTVGGYTGTSYKLSENKDCNDRCIQIQESTKINGTSHDDFSCTCM